MNPMRKLLDTLLDHCTEEGNGVMPLQLEFQNTMPAKGVAGAVRRAQVVAMHDKPLENIKKGDVIKIDGLYELLAPATPDDPRGRMKKMKVDEVKGLISVFFRAEDLANIQVIHMDEPSSLIVPDFGAKPGLSLR